MWPLKYLYFLLKHNQYTLYHHNKQALFLTTNYINISIFFKGKEEESLSLLYYIILKLKLVKSVKVKNRILILIERNIKL